MPNLYAVVSETLYERIGLAKLIPCSSIVELVSAKSRGQARYLAWLGDKNSDPSDLTSMPNFHTRKICSTCLPVGIVYDSLESEEYKSIWQSVDPAIYHFKEIPL